MLKTIPGHSQMNACNQCCACMVALWHSQKGNQEMGLLQVTRSGMRNGKQRGAASPQTSDTPLLYVLRNDLDLRGPRFRCGLGQCGACKSSSTARRSFLASLLFLRVSRTECSQEYQAGFSLLGQDEPITNTLRIIVRAKSQ